ncbi:hypothetical protein BC832DRAFT_556014, partial [Gaertneriomyces semiglobifer]
MADTRRSSTSPSPPPSPNSSGSGNGSNARVKFNRLPCHVCQKSPIAYAAVPCGHASLCKQCAMKQATGGKCRVCHQLFGELRKI